LLFILLGVLIVVATTAGFFSSHLRNVEESETAGESDGEGSGGELAREANA
jgi:hypothetical protein